MRLARATVSCSCVSVELPAAAVSPGQKSQVVLRVQSVRNTTQRHLGVAIYLDGEAQPMMLSAIVDVDPGVRFEPTSLYWPKDGSAMAEQTATLVPAEGVAIKSVEVEPNEAFAVRVVQLPGGTSARLEIKPIASPPPPASSLKAKVNLRDGTKVEAELWLISKSSE